MEKISIEKDGFAGIFLPAEPVPGVSAVSGASAKPETSTAPESTPGSVIIYCDGAGNTPEEAVHNGAFLTKTGCPVLILGYYNWEGLPGTMSEVPVEYVEKAILWLTERLGKEELSIGIAGMSAGGQYALLAASLIPGIKATAVAATYDYLVEGTDSGLHRLKKSPFSYRNKPLPYAPLSVMDGGLVPLMLKIILYRKYGIGRMLRYGYDHSPVTEEARIKVENLSGSLMLLAAENDDCLPAEETVRRVRKKLEACGFPHRLETHIYEKGSHILGCDFDMNSKDGKEAKKIFKAWKLYPEECQQAMEDSRERMITFFQEELCQKIKMLSHLRVLEAARQEFLEKDFEAASIRSYRSESRYDFRGLVSPLQG